MNDIKCVNIDEIVEELVVEKSITTVSIQIDLKNKKEDIINSFNNTLNKKETIDDEQYKPTNIIKITEESVDKNKNDIKDNENNNENKNANENKNENDDKKKDLIKNENEVVIEDKNNENKNKNDNKDNENKNEITKENNKSKTFLGFFKNFFYNISTCNYCCNSDNREKKTEITNLNEGRNIEQNL